MTQAISPVCRPAGSEARESVSPSQHSYDSTWIWAARPWFSGRLGIQDLERLLTYPILQPYFFIIMFAF